MQKFQGIFIRSGIFYKILLLVAISMFFTLAILPLVGLLQFSKLDENVFLKLSQLLMSVGMFVIPPFVFAYLCSENNRSYLHINLKINWQAIFLVFVFMILIIPFINLLSDLNQRVVLPSALSGIENQLKIFEEKASKLTENLLNVHSFGGLFINIVVIAIIPALGEELFFRGALQSILKDWKGLVVGIWLTAFIFSAIHLQFYGFVPRMLMGAFFGYLLMWSENLWLPIAAHFTNNVIAVIFYYVQFNGVQTFNIDTIGTGNTLWIGILSGIVGVFGVLFIKKYFRKRE